MKHRANYGDATGCVMLIIPLLLLTLYLGTAFAATIKDITLEKHPPLITVIALYNGHTIPAGWIDSTTRPDATHICNQLIASQSKLYANAISNSRCIIQVQEDDE